MITKFQRVSVFVENTFCEISFKKFKFQVSVILGIPKKRTTFRWNFILIVSLEVLFGSVLFVLFSLLDF